VGDAQDTQLPSSTVAAGSKFAASALVQPELGGMGPHQYSSANPSAVLLPSDRKDTNNAPLGAPNVWPI
jgi:hypothetical protein